MKLDDIRDKIPQALYNSLLPAIDQLRPAQEKSIESGLLDGSNIVVCTPTASGKCLDYDSRVLLADGRIVKIGELCDCPQTNLKVMSLDEKNLQIVPKSVSGIHRIYHNKPLLQIKGMLGNVVKVTPEHPFLVKNEDSILWVRADNLKEGDYIIVPRFTKVSPKKFTFCKEWLLDAFSGAYVKNNKLVDELAKRLNKPFREIAKQIQVDEKDLYRWRKRTAIPLDKLFQLANLAHKNIIPQISKVSDINGMSCVMLPKKVTIKIARLLGLIIADGSIHYKKSALVAFTNMDYDLRMEFKDICRNEFGIHSKAKMSDGKSPQENAYSKVFCELLMGMGIPSGSKSSNVIVPEYMFLQPLNIVSAFLSALFDCDGSVYDKGIEYSTDSGELVFGVQNLLLRYGIVSIIKKRYFKGKHRYRLFIYRKGNLIIFQNRIGFMHDCKRKRLKDWIQNKKNESTNIDVIPFISNDFKILRKELNLNPMKMPASFESYLYGWRKNISYFNLKKFAVKYLKKPMSPIACKLLTLAESHVYFDRVAEISKTMPAKYVYDLTVPETSNFIAENMIVHNTLIAELTGVKRILEYKGKMIYIAPLKALANEKYNDFKKRYGLYIRIALSIGDLDSSDSYLENYDMIICTAEKLDSLIRHSAPWLSKVATVVIDEVHVLDDPGRGPTLEILMTMLKQMLKDVQIIALSATIGNPEELAAWLDARLVIDDWRPVKLYKGIYLEGKVKFKEEK